MPSHSRTRGDRSNYRDRVERDYYSRHKRHNQDDRIGDDEVEVELDDDDDEEEDDDDNANEYNYRPQQERSSAVRRGESQGYGRERHDYHEVEVEEEESDDEDDNEDDREDEDNRYPVVDRHRTRQESVPRRLPDEPPRTPRQSRHDREEKYRDGYSKRRTRERTPKAKESPATSPKKKLDREGHRRNTSRARDGSPLRERRRHRHDRDARAVADRDRNQTRDQEYDRELRRQQRRKERRERESAAQKHKSADSTNSASQLLSAEALARLDDYNNRERMKANNQRNEDEDDGRERRRQRTRETVALVVESEDDEDGRIRVEKRRDRRRRTPTRRQSDRRDDEYRRQRKKTLYDDNNDADLVSPRQAQKRRLVSGAVMEEGRSNKLLFWRGFGRRNNAVDGHDIGGGGGDGNGSLYSRDIKDPGNDDSYNHMPFWRRRWAWILAGIVVLILIIVIPIAIVESKKSSGSTSSGGGGNGGSYGTYNSSLNTISEDSIPASAKGTYLDPFTWYDTRDFNLTYTNETVGGLPIMGLNSTWDNSAQPNSNVPPLTQNFTYGTTPIRGVSIGGWLSLEPFITPSLFSTYSSQDGVVDEWTLTQKLGPNAVNTLENHYTTFIQEEDFAQIAAAGLDHVRIPYSYWAVTTYEDDPYVEQVSWRYLLRAIEYCRKYGLRVNLDLHGLPGSQNGYNHSGRQGLIRWLNGTDGDLNAQRSLDIHNQLSQFFAQPRYQNIITIYGLANEPPLLALDVSTVLNWTTSATNMVQKNGINAMIAMGDGFLNLDKWQFMMKTDAPPNMLLDTHQYTIFNVNEIDLNHTAKISLMCETWLPMIKTVNSKTTGWGPTICGEFSQADTDCTEYLNNVSTGSRWEGTLDGKSTPDCPTKSSACSCANAVADVSTFTDEYKLWLQTYAEAQFSVFETAMGWFYWTWQTESAPQWSYKQALDGGFMPQLAYKPNFTCSDSVPSFGNLPETY